MTREELEDIISEALQDSMDIDWNSSTGAHYVADALEKEGIWPRGPKDVKYSYGPNTESVGLIEDSPSTEPEDDVIEVMIEQAFKRTFSSGFFRDTRTHAGFVAGYRAALAASGLLERERVLREALALAEDVLSRSPFSTEMWPNGMHPNAGITIIRTALSNPLKAD
jgi:hypothetical protein